MAGTTPAGPVTCPECGRTVKGYQSVDWRPGGVKEILVYPHKHRHADGTPDCPGRYRRVREETR